MSMFSGVIPPLLTPLTADGDVDADELRSLIEFQIAAGVTGVFMLGSSGEAIYLPDPVRRDVVRIAVEAVAGRVPVLAGALDSTPRRVASQITWLADEGIAGLVVTAPFYANVSAPEVAEHFRIAASASSLPILAYDIPGNTGRKLSPDVLISLLDEGVIVGLKDSSNVLPDFRTVAEGVRDRDAASLLTGADTTADLALSLGADGFVAGLSNVRPDLFVDMLAAHRAGDAQAVAGYQARVNRLSGIYGVAEQFGIGRHASELGAMKHALCRMGVLHSETVSAPLSSYPADAVAPLDRILDSVDS